ncbi:uncharacterized protein B0H18DRAFT_377820 [Fomitopsis serialis]|uniref:uncharacterized protein n=1 Tax=Fomitopsis serialis TaxID=139415 RepID=UPI002007B7A9|nr:uncharacterized protein B0H18DRAFT_377820 [Neoantrodia serialis]KAH9911297.1 hypothetical protein B0H18DRAFT_377820 [Neoantrodia serialis]
MPGDDNDMHMCSHEHEHEHGVDVDDMLTATPASPSFLTSHHHHLPLAPALSAPICPFSRPSHPHSVSRLAQLDPHTPFFPISTNSITNRDRGRPQKTDRGLQTRSPSCPIDPAPATPGLSLPLATRKLPLLGRRSPQLHSTHSQAGRGALWRGLDHVGGPPTRLKILRHKRCRWGESFSAPPSLVDTSPGVLSVLYIGLQAAL